MSTIPGLTCPHGRCVVPHGRFVVTYPCPDCERARAEPSPSMASLSPSLIGSWRAKLAGFDALRVTDHEGAGYAEQLWQPTLSCVEVRALLAEWGRLTEERDEALARERRLRSALEAGRDALLKALYP